MQANIGTPIGPGFFIFFQQIENNGAGGQLTDQSVSTFPYVEPERKRKENDEAIAIMLLLKR